MPLYYFDVADNGALVTDDFGVELDDLYEAREQAIALLPDMARNEMPDGDRHEFSAVVRCSGGRVRYEAKLVFEGRWIEPPTYGRLSLPLVVPPLSVVESAITSTPSKAASDDLEGQPTPLN